MIHPAPTSKIDPAIARGVLEEIHPATATRPACVVVSFPNTNYQMYLVPTTDPLALQTHLHKRILGTIRLDARRVDVVDTGGRYLEPVLGRPRRVQGSVISIDRTHNALVIDAGAPIHAGLTDERQNAADFKPGDLVSFDAMDGATFTPAP
jgi:hypothetical protein